MRRSKRMKGRKVRNLENGKWYVSKRQAQGANCRSAAAKARVDPDLIMKCTKANGTKKAIKKKSQSVKRYAEKHPEWLNALFEKGALFYYGRNGKRVIRIVHCEREKTIGVNTY